MNVPLLVYSRHSPSSVVRPCVGVSSMASDSIGWGKESALQRMARNDADDASVLGIVLELLSGQPSCSQRLCCLIPSSSFNTSNVIAWTEHKTESSHASCTHHSHNSSSDDGRDDGRDDEGPSLLSSTSSPASPAFLAEPFPPTTKAPRLGGERSCHTGGDWEENAQASAALVTSE